MIRFGSRLLPVHFVGLLAEGNFPSGPLGVHYGAGVGNGRHDDIARAGDSGDVNEHRAFLAHVFARPHTIFGLQAGGGVYLDQADVDGIELDERILSAHVVLARERPEAIAEYARITHEPDPTGGSFGTDAGYLQLAYRLPPPADRLKPYARYERIEASDDDPLFAPFALDYEAGIAGLRFDFSTFAALKAELRAEDTEDEGSGWSAWLQAAFTFGPGTDDAVAVDAAPASAAR